MITITQQDVDVLARTVYGEARGEQMQGKLAVAYVIMNRVRADLHGDEKPDWWGEGIVGVCLRDRQFSCWNHNDPNRTKLMTVGPDDKAFAECIGAALMAIHRLQPDPTDGADHYLASHAWADWAKGRPFVSIGRHRFFHLN
ncbi:cell wall hydrolase [Pelagibius sp.]|uniref:cell wall hydrolase n=1 Tax=Pelagibius sp. TaxID=1931238 RepID=UPI00262AD912|nr:cell wall hydrolase [Pelagibius sp.]